MNRIYITHKERLSEKTECDCCNHSLLIAHYLSNGDLVGSECAEDIEQASSRMKYKLSPMPWTPKAVIEYLGKEAAK